MGEQKQQSKIGKRPRGSNSIGKVRTNPIGRKRPSPVLPPLPWNYEKGPWVALRWSDGGRSSMDLPIYASPLTA